MLLRDDTIVAVATPPGHGGVGVVRVSGPASFRIASLLTGRTAAWRPRHVTRAGVAADGIVADALVTVFAAPSSYTGEDVVEIAAHGNPLLLAAIVARAVDCGARPAQPGEFTLRAFVRGKLDLVQAEAVRDLVEAVSPAQVRNAARQVEGSLSARIGAIAMELRRLETLLEASVDFPDEGYRFVDGSEVASAIAGVRQDMTTLLGDEAAAAGLRDGVQVVITGAPNVGKSSLFNALLGIERSIVTSTPGTTRDLVSERLVLGGALVRLVDSAGVRTTTDLIEREGVRRASAATAAADLVVFVLDQSVAPTDEDRARLAGLDGPVLVVANKCDLRAALDASDVGRPVLRVSATTGEWLSILAQAIGELLRGVASASDAAIVANPRQRASLRASLGFIEHACSEFALVGPTLPEEFVLHDLRGALDALDDVVGRRSREEILGEIFQTFCIGK